MGQDIKQFEQRKQDHIRLALDSKSQADPNQPHPLDGIQLVHEALPDLNFDQVCLDTEALGRQFPTPFYVSGMTAGHAQARVLNDAIASACLETGWIMGVGSQRRELFDKQAVEESLSFRRRFPSLAILGNIGISQLIQTPMAAIKALIQSLDPIGLCVHTNPLQECLQPEGTPQFKGSAEALSAACEQLDCPIILKETGCGFSKKTLSRLSGMGLAAVDLSGYGGTHWGRIEGQRHEQDSLSYQAALTFKAWGLSTADSLLSTLDLTLDYALWASGGVRSGLDAAKLLAMGAGMVGFAQPVLAAAINKGSAGAIELMHRLAFELKIALFCTGHADLAAMRLDRAWQ